MTVAQTEPTARHRNTFAAPRAVHRASAPGRGFTLVELLTVVFIISLLIGILIPSINAARTQAKKTSTSKTLSAVETGLEMFKNDNAAEFRLTGGYPPSFVHPPIQGHDQFNQRAWEGLFPFLPDSQQPVKVYGAHWLPAMLMGVDQLGYVKRSAVSRDRDRELPRRPWLWYATDTAGVPWVPTDQRHPLYLDPGNTPVKPTRNLLGRPNPALFPDWGRGVSGKKMEDLPVIVDAFGQAVLYYVATTHGKTTNMVEDGTDPQRRQDNDYKGGPQEVGVPYYFHQDNEGFTGNRDQPGWDYAGRKRPHAIAVSGAELNAQELLDPENFNTFARYVLDRQLYRSLSAQLEGGSVPPAAPLRPVNADSFLLISAGPDGLYGTNDDVSNLPPWPQD